MSMLINYVKSFANQEEGQDLLEYALLVALIALIAIVAVGQAGGAVSTIFTNIANALQNAAVAIASSQAMGRPIIPLPYRLAR